jgi:hypothetical protein
MPAEIHDMPDRPPRLTAALVVGANRTRAEKALRSLLLQTGIDQVEVLIIDCVPPGTPPMAGCDHPAVRVIQIPPPAIFGDLRAEAVRQARAPVIAFMEEHCLALPGWVRAQLEAHEGAWTAVGGEVHNANPGVGFSNITHLSSYTDWLPGGTRREMAMLPGHNTSYKRDVLLRYEANLSDLLMSETTLQWRLTQDGHKLLFDPAVQFAHNNEARPESWLEYYYWSRYLGATRAVEFRWPVWKRVVYALLWPASPWLRLVRLYSHVLRQYPSRLWTLLWNTPILVAGLHFAAFGQAVGVLLGPGNVAHRFTEYELGLRNTR